MYLLMFFNHSSTHSLYWGQEICNCIWQKTSQQIIGWKYIQCIHIITIFMYNMWTKMIPFPPSTLYISYKITYFHNILLLMLNFICINANPLLSRINLPCFVQCDRAALQKIKMLKCYCRAPDNLEFSPFP